MKSYLAMLALLIQLVVSYCHKFGLSNDSNLILTVLYIFNSMC